MNKQISEHELIAELKALQDSLTDEWIETSLPDAWNGLDTDAPVTPAKTRVTVRLDADMVRWFRKMGPGYGARINQVLRLYWLGLASGKVRSHWDKDAHAPRFARYMEKRIEAQLGKGAR